MSNCGNSEGNNILVRRRTPIIFQNSAAYKEAVGSNQARMGSPMDPPMGSPMGSPSTSEKIAYGCIHVWMLIFVVYSIVQSVAHCRE